MQLAKGFPVAIMNFSFQGQKKGGIAICGNSLTCSGIFLLILTIAKAKKNKQKKPETHYYTYINFWWNATKRNLTSESVSLAQLLGTFSNRYIIHLPDL